MSYTDEEHDALMEENTPFDADALHDEYMSSHGNMVQISFADLKIGENRGAFESLKEEIDWKTPIDLEFIIIKGCPNYKFFSVSESETKYLNLNKQILNYIYSYFENNVLGENLPSDFVGATNAGENYILHLLKRDRQNEKLSYDPKTGYKATYNLISINYGKLPYTPEDLGTKLDSLG